MTIPKYADPETRHNVDGAWPQTQLARCEAQEGCEHVGFCDLAVTMSRRTTSVARLNAEALIWLSAGIAMIAFVAAILGHIGN